MMNWFKQNPIMRGAFVVLAAITVFVLANAQFNWVS